MDCVFCKIIHKEIASEIIYEDKNFIVFNDINPIAPVHILIIPKEHVPTLDLIELHDKELIGEMILTAKKIAENQAALHSGYRLIFNVGRDAGQTVNHLHLHLLGGKKLLWL